MAKYSLLRLPPEGYKGLAVLIGLGEGGVRKLAEELSKQQLTLDFDSLAQHLGEVLGRSEGDVEELLSTLSGLSHLCQQRGYEPREFIRVLTEAMGQSAPEEWREKYLDGWQSIVELIEPLFQPDQFGALSSKALQLLYSRPALLFDFKVLTELRPVFDSGADEIKAMILSNTVVIEYAESGGETRSLYLSVDSDDLDNILKQLERTRKKNSIVSLKATHWSVDILEQGG